MQTTEVKTRDLEGAALDWAVGYAVHGEARPASTGWKFGEDWLIPDCDDYGWLDGPYSPSTDWGQGGPLIEERVVEVTPMDKANVTMEWQAQTWMPYAVMRGPTALIAAMRAIVSSELGDTVDIPEELVKS